MNMAKIVTMVCLRSNDMRKLRGSNLTSIYENYQQVLVENNQNPEVNFRAGSRTQNS